MTEPLPRQSLAVDMTRCDGHGICALVHPEGIRLDAWGFPIVDAAVLDDRRRWRAARRAARACPKRALTLVDVPAPVVANTVGT